MLDIILLYIANIIIFISVIVYFFTFLINKNKIISKKCGFDIAKDSVSEYDSINIIEGNSNFSFYNIKRKVIKLSKSDYYGSSISNVSNSILQAGISVCTNKNRFVDIVKKVLPTLKLFDLFSIFLIILNSITFNYSDVKINIILLSLILIMHYFYNGILNNSFNWISDNLKLKDKNKILNYINIYIICNTIIFISELVILLRFILIIVSF